MGPLLPFAPLQTMLGIEAQPGSRWDLYVYGGDEYYSRAAYMTPPGLPVGYGSRLNNNSGCQLEVPGTQPCEALILACRRLQGRPYISHTSSGCPHVDKEYEIHLIRLMPT